MENHPPKPNPSPIALELWRKPGVDFDRGRKSTLAELLAIGGFFPLSKVEDRIPLCRSRLKQWAREGAEGEFASCVKAIRADGRGRAMMILVDLVRLNELLSAQIQGPACGLSPDHDTPGLRPRSLAGV